MTLQGRAFYGFFTLPLLRLPLYGWRRDPRYNESMALDTLIADDIGETILHSTKMKQQSTSTIILR